MFERLNDRGWLWMLIASILMDFAAGLTLAISGLDIPKGIFAAIALICTAGAYKNYRKENYNG